MSLMYQFRGRHDCPRSVFLAIPVGDGKPFANHTVALLNAESALAEAGWGVAGAIEANNCHVDDCRNSLVREFLQSECEALVFLDADVGWRDEDLVRLVSHERDIVAGIYPKKTDKVEFPINLMPGPQWKDNDGLLEVERVPTGFLKIRRAVLESLAADAKTIRGNDAPPGTPGYPVIFERTSDAPGGRRWSGDYAFCNKAKARGFRIWIDPEMHFSHAGIKKWTGCLGDHLRSLNGLDHPAMATALADIRERGADAENLTRLFLADDNQWAAPPEILFVAHRMALATRGALLECGSGISTLVMGLAAEKSGAVIHTLEHDIEWADKMRARLARYGIKTVRLHYAPLRDAEGCRWYEIPRGLPTFDAAVCDGPPRRFGRDGLVTHLWWAIERATLLLDDANDPVGLALAERVAEGRPVHVLDAPSIPGRKFAIVDRRVPMELVA